MSCGENGSKNNSINGEGEGNNPIEPPPEETEPIDPPKNGDIKKLDKETCEKMEKQTRDLITNAREKRENLSAINSSKISEKIKELNLSIDQSALIKHTFYEIYRPEESFSRSLKINVKDIGTGEIIENYNAYTESQPGTVYEIIKYEILNDELSEEDQKL